jgi:hypothetical protein
MGTQTKKGKVILHLLGIAVALSSCAAPCQASDLDTRSILILTSQAPPPVVASLPQPIILPTSGIIVGSATPVYFPQPVPVIYQPVTVRSWAAQPTFRSNSCFGRG